MSCDDVLSRGQNDQAAACCAGSRLTRFVAIMTEGPVVVNARIRSGLSWIVDATIFCGRGIQAFFFSQPRSRPARRQLAIGEGIQRPPSVPGFVARKREIANNDKGRGRCNAFGVYVH